MLSGHRPLLEDQRENYWNPVSQKGVTTEGADANEAAKRTDAVARRAGECSSVAELTGAHMVVQGVGVVDPFVDNARI